MKQTYHLIYLCNVIQTVKGTIDDLNTYCMFSVHLVPGLAWDYLKQDNN